MKLFKLQCHISIFKEKIKSLNIEEGKKDVKYEAKTGNNKRIKGKI